MEDVTATLSKPGLKIGPYQVDPPVVLAPMAGITNFAFRRLCQEYGAGIYVCEMITARAVVERHPGTMHMMTFFAQPGHTRPILDARPNPPLHHRYRLQAATRGCAGG